MPITVLEADPQKGEIGINLDHGEYYRDIISSFFNLFIAIDFSWVVLPGARIKTTNTGVLQVELEDDNSDDEPPPLESPFEETPRPSCCYRCTVCYPRYLYAKL
ncbi:hypothetical protein FB451DRAFT_1399019 [Mycena latifolia]|nr:hypothetical protein FB451DRAFT_1399019 [Mycena latifolia]